MMFAVALVSSCTTSSQRVRRRATRVVPSDSLRKRRGVQQRRDERARAFGPVIVAAIAATASRDVDKAPCEAKPRHPTSKTVESVSNQFGAHLVVYALFPTDRRAMLHLRDARDINDTTSFFVDVTTQERFVIRRFGMMSDDVFPLRLGPNTSVERSSPLVASPRAPRPK
jgi:hypothetical protein